MFQPAPPDVNFPALEAEILAFWQTRGVYEQSLARRAGAPRFVFYEGPPTANGLPHPGHCLTRAIKDLFPRYHTMRGRLCERKAGWDTHGLPVEVEVCKELGIHAKEEIEKYGVEPFIHRCQESVWRYMQEWERLTQRLGFWIHLDEAYVTYHQSYVESVWWSLKTLFDRGLLYQGHKIVWWWAQGGTSLSAGEVGLGYREVADPSVYVRFPLVDEPDTALLVWTTTPWTLPSNQFAAVRPELEYVTVADGDSGRKLVLAAGLRAQVAAKAKRDLPVLATRRGTDLVGLRYTPPFDYYYRAQGGRTGQLKPGAGPARAGGAASQAIAWRVVGAAFVTLESGTGVVHQAPAFGEVDFDLLRAEQERFVSGEGPPLICAVAPDGKFTDEAPDYTGRWVKDCDKEICRDLRARGLLFHQEQYPHEYPFCWRADNDPLIQYPRKSWFIRTTRFRDRMLANNRRVRWLPEHIRDGRFGNFLESNVDWSLSRERYWGTPLPIWVCEQTGRMEAVASYDELLAKPGAAGVEAWTEAKRRKPSLPDDLRVHKPYIDAITYDSPFAAGARMRRVPDVIDCWYDSGAMPFAQWGYPRRNRDKFAEQFPADFISEAIDQTRGWFYSLLAISTLLFGEDEERAPAAAANKPLTGSETTPANNTTPANGLGAANAPETPVAPWPHPFRNCVVLGLMLGEDGEKMSKSKRNYREPNEIFNKYGADALRWYFFANQAPWTSIRYKEQAIKDSVPEFLLRLWNVYSFFVTYANIDGFDPAGRLPGEAGQLGPAELARAAGWRRAAERGELDRWVLSALNRAAADVVAKMEAYDNFGACQTLSAFVDGLSNWYVRRARPRFWSDRHDQDKLDAYFTLYECLLTTAKLIAPFTPFLADTLWRNLAGVFGERALASAHWCDYPTGLPPAGEPSAIDDALSRRMELAREIASLGRAARMEAKLKVRQPLAKVEVILADAGEQAWLAAHDGLLREELNVKQVEYATRADQYIDYLAQPNFARLGPKLGKLLPAAKKALAEADAAKLLAELRARGQATLAVGGQTITLDPEDVRVGLRAKPGWAAAQGARCVVVLSTDVSPELAREGLARDLARLIQDRRKEIGCQYTDRVDVVVTTDSPEVGQAIAENQAHLQSETLAASLRVAGLGETPTIEGSGVAAELGEAKITLFVKPRAE